jgi:carbon-monoxide dehydrogenase medium subunit
VRQTVLAPDEIVVDLSFPLPSAETHTAFIKLGLRRAQAISVVNAAVVLELQDGEVRRARIALGSVAPTVIRAQRAEEYLAGRPLTAEAIAQAADLAAQAVSPIDDLRASAEYRREMVRVCVRRVLAPNEGRAGFPDRPVLLGGRGMGQGPRGPASMVAHGRGQPIHTTINGRKLEFQDGHDKTLLRLLRENAGLTGTKEGCDEGECGACTVFLDGAAVMACLVPAPRAHGAEIVTVEGLAREGIPHPLQTAFVEQGAVQCGYCTPGFLMAGAKLLEEQPHPDRDEITQAVAGNLCRCTGYYSILSAIEQAALQAGVDDPGGRG